jgi:transcriptional regulator GlxA family with amidase domain
VQIAIPTFEKMTALDAIGPYEVLQRLPGAEVMFVGAAPGTIRSDNGMLGLVVDKAYGDLPHPDVIVFPGGIGTRPLMKDAAVLAWLQEAHRHSSYTTSVCTGALVLGAAGLLTGLDATTHWGSYDTLAELGAHPTSERVVERGKIITAAGVSSGIDMALRLAELLTDETTAKAMQLIIEYDPQPPFDAGALAKCTPEVVERVVEIAAVRD